MSRQLSTEKEISDMIVKDMRSKRGGKKEYLVDFILTDKKLTAWIADEVLEKSLKSAREMATTKKPEKKTKLEQNSPETTRRTPSKGHVPRKEQQVKQPENITSRPGSSKSTERSNSRSTSRDRRVRFLIKEEETHTASQGVVTRSRAKADKTHLLTGVNR